MTRTRKTPTPAPTTADLVAALVAAGPALLADTDTYPDLVLVSCPASGPYSKPLLARDRAWFGKGDGTAWAMCYSVVAGTATATRAKVAGCVWGYANSRASADADVARKDDDLRNVRDVLVPGSVFATPTVIVPPSAVDDVKALLADAAQQWADAAVAHSVASARASKARATRAARK